MLFLGVDEFEMLAVLVILLGLWLALSWDPARGGGVCFGKLGSHLVLKNHLHK